MSAVLSAIKSSMGEIHGGSMSPVQSTGDGFNTGKTTHGFTLYEAYMGAAVALDRRIDAISGMVAEGLTVTEFDEAVKAAIDSAKAADTLAGFKPADGAKGRDKYGPKQNTIVQRASEMRQVFGYLKLTSPDMHSGGYLETVKAAREWLKEKAIDWTGAALPDKVQKAAAAQVVADAKAEKAALLSTPMLEGETAEQWSARVDARVETLKAEAQEQATMERMQKACDAIAKAFDGLDVYSIGLSLMRSTIAAGTISRDEAITDLCAE